MNSVLFRSNRITVCLVLVASLLSVPVSAKPPAKSRKTAAPQTLEQVLDQIARRAPARSSGVSVAVAELDSGQVIYARNPDQPETLASVTKMLSSAAAIHFLGPEYKFKTSFWRKGDVQNGLLNGSLLVVGGGDPNISGRFYENDSFAVFDRWAEGLKQAGVVRVGGDLILNAGGFDRIYRNPEWPPDRDTRWYQAPVSALSYNENMVIVSVGRGALPGAPAIVSIDPDTDVVQAVPRARNVGKTGKLRIAVARPGGGDQVYVDGTLPARYFRYSVPLAIDDPPKFFGAALRSRLRAAGIELAGSVVERDMQPDNAWALVASTESDLLPTMAVANKHSQNFYAEQIFKTLAFEKSGRGTWDNALALQRQFFAAIGLDPSRYELHDGSGLSASNRVAAADLIRFLRAMNAHPNGAAWRATLAVSGDSEGSMRNRLLDSLTRGQVQAKTGTLNGVSNLAGYAQASSGKTYVFAILLNGAGVTESRGHAYQDRLVRALIQKG
ncbi:MAG TPA: D-alanyl-D-alanine carboxypeptidase/D-alanyl-D-alanine-endopeptidase [Thermoanaerobaculia bacterium]|nr:D-alanyl-D-alanine carboxypeptidase/D-alanyl-D-alanine-endopeptidase [Thermoanaerobaculia bacterium]